MKEFMFKHKRPVRLFRPLLTVRTIRTIRTLWMILLILLVVSCSQKSVVRFGVCADVHKDIMHDADQRLRVFVNEMNAKNVDFIVQLGDFCQPQEYNSSFLAIWNTFEGPAYHVLGNHDMDNSLGERYTRETAKEYLNMPAQYYSFDLNGYHFIVLNGNDEKDPPQKGYAHFIGAEQQTWLKEDLSKAKFPVIVFSHQSLEDPGGVENAEDVREILEDANSLSKKSKVIASFSGHHHIDFSKEINGIHYIQINSMSYYWMGSEYLQVRYSKETDEKYPYIKYTAPYKDPLFALVEIDSRGVIRITGRESTWVGPSPWDLDYPEAERDKIVPRIAGKELKF